MGTKISELTEVTTPDGADVLPIVSGGETKKVTVTNLVTPAGFAFSEDVGFGSRISGDDATDPVAIVVGDTDAAFAYVQLDPDATDGAPAIDLYAQNADGSVSAEITLHTGSNAKIDIVLTGLGLVVTGLPDSDPLVIGQIYSDGTPTVDTPKVLKISGGTA